MKTMLFMLFVMLADGRWALGQTPATNPPSSTGNPTAALDPAKVAEYQKRFQQGYDLEKAGQLSQARAIYDGILAEQPDAKRSLLEAGRVSLEMNDPQKAEDYLDRLHTIVPQFPEAIELLIQASEALKHDVKAERLVREYRTLRDSGTVPGFSDSLFFERERVPLDAGSEVVISQFFDFTKPPYCALKAELFDAQHKGQRVVLLKYDPEGTQMVRAKDPKLARDDVFTLIEPFYTGTRMTKVSVYKELMSTPEYTQARSMMLLIFASASKPIYSAPVADPSGQ